jgi:leucyl/phenylalanyl-tRNA--protein transferase
MPIEPPPSPWLLPDPALADPGSDVVGIGADLAPGTLLEAYRCGMFAMHVDGGEIGWWSPDPRGVLPIDALRVTKSMRRSAKRFRISVDEAFGEVMLGCGDRPNEERWINDEIVAGFTRLHDLGWAHSVEVWLDDRLVGGLYGVEIGGLFAGESMFHRERDASKVALMALVDRLRAAGGARLLDVQWVTHHLGTLGAVEIPRIEYLELVRHAVELDPCLSRSGESDDEGQPRSAIGRID